jgi:uncharacterized protein
MAKDKEKKTYIPSWESLLKKKKSEETQADHIEAVAKREEGQTEETLHVSGMTCNSCEVRIERVLSKIDGMKHVKAKFADSSVALAYDSAKVTRETIRESLSKIGYEVSTKEKSFSIPQLIGIGAIIAVLFLLISQSGIFSLVPQISKNASYWILLATGVLISVHCVGMCGAINISQSLKTRDTDEPAKAGRFLPGILYNGGRVISYTIIGGIVGAIGSAVSFSRTVQTVIIIVTGFIMIIMGLNILGVFPFLKRFQLRLPRFFGSKVGKAASGRSPLIVGLLNGLMPCGPLQSMQLYALGTGSFINGALSMFFFSLGTVPLLLGVNALSSILNKKFALRMIKVSAILVFFLGAGMIVRGLSLSGIGIGPLVAQPKNFATIDGNYQYVTTTLKSGAYEPITVYAGIPVKWTVSAAESEINGCNSPMTVPSYNITKTLDPGANLVEFTPREPGTIIYTCWMGMIKSTIKVLPNPNGTAGAGANAASSGSGTGSVEAVADANNPIPTLPPDTSSAGGTPQVAVATLLGNGIQVVQTDLPARGYPAFIVQKGIPVRWTFRADKANLTSCNSRFVIPDLGIEKELVPGDNVIEFTPAKEGAIQYTCWMKMLRSAIYVVADLGDGQAIASAKNRLGTLSPSGGASCCSGGTTGGGCCGGSNLPAQKVDPKDLTIGVATLGSGVQTVTTELGPWGYTPIVVQKGIPVRWNLHADAKILSNCNYRFIIPDLRMRKELQAGDNVIEFTPAKEGALPFSCWMQMLQSAIFVLGDINDRNTIESIRTKWVEYASGGGTRTSGGGCCGG